MLAKATKKSICLPSDLLVLHNEQSLGKEQQLLELGPLKELAKPLDDKITSGTNIFN